MIVLKKVSPKVKNYYKEENIEVVITYLLCIRMELHSIIKYFGDTIKIFNTIKETK
jgi:hypothetical protein